MRELRFRGKRKDNGEWVYGYYIYNEHMGVIKHIIATNYAQIYVNSFYIDGETVGQLTGLKDKNGKDIYEGDVCEVKYKSGKKFNNVIRFLNAAFTFRSYYLHRVAEDVLDEFCTIRVVGNIHENPELKEATT